MGRVNGHTSEQVIDAIRANYGILAAAARELGITRTTIQRYVHNYPTIKVALEEEREKWVDLAEHELIKQIRKGNITAIMFFLKTVGRNRGYIERKELTGADGDAVTIRVVYDEDGQS